MAPATHYQYLVIGGGSGGVSSARRAASYGAKTLLIEGKYLGGTCVNVGCVPKKVMWNAGDMASKLQIAAKGYNFDLSSSMPIKFDWASFKVKRDAYVARLRQIYANNLEKEKVDYVEGWAELVDKHTVRVKLNAGGEAVYTADRILIATGGAPIMPTNIPGAELGVTSDGFFEIATYPKAIAVVGAGYIGVEISGLLNALGVESHLIIRGDTVLRKFDDMIQQEVTNAYVKHGVKVHKGSNVQKIEKAANGRLTVHYGNDKESTAIEVDHLIWALGRHPLSKDMNLTEVGIELDSRGKVVTDEYQNTSVPNIFSVGDMSEKVELTPVAVAAGRKLSDRLFNNKPKSKLSYENIPSVVFSHPEAGTIGLTEKQAREKFDKVKVYQSKFINMFYAPCEQEDKDYTVYKLIVEGDNERVVGLHLFGDASSEILQGFGVAVKMGATKADFDSCVAIHPTAAEEIVTLR
ncbi:Glutathione reductase [Wickerhamiella sorbophila]|uniref:Glutathione reductase n=1 Tax=Wickerhamiella sorbophila TaxID=45607 RepID=A0A2T0FH83_9ASCO|nr:Glutathione reductase [Wickerhamiella sorbophila]PRT54351.1 Glutathione reductase [Wickerhamiella sorbophila]